MTFYDNQNYIQQIKNSQNRYINTNIQKQQEQQQLQLLQQEQQSKLLQQQGTVSNEQQLQLQNQSIFDINQQQQYLEWEEKLKNDINQYIQMDEQQNYLRQENFQQEMQQKHSVETNLSFYEQQQQQDKIVVIQNKNQQENQQSSSQTKKIQSQINEQSKTSELRIIQNQAEQKQYEIDQDNNMDNKYSSGQQSSNSRHNNIFSLITNDVDADYDNNDIVNDLAEYIYNDCDVSCAEQGKEKQNNSLNDIIQYYEDNFQHNQLIEESLGNEFGADLWTTFDDDNDEKNDKDI
eukprot:TRINITY_DN6368_c1_g1_i1.p1 TRINITY_DN6368_c1_g1~~TRINITY_DN6368_c1_g1_i1.p1  ORF type:complete len:292 (+),score=42.22 TRINITY_DN6368_c1_g1_i1:1084-1959(+)